MMFYYGVDHYPEHVSLDLWEEDARLMQAANINVVRMAEFAWSRMEPAPGQFDFEWLDQSIEIMAQHGIVTVLGTPTASPPPWVMEMYPDAYLVRRDGKPATYGYRRGYCPTHAGYRELCARITRAM